MKYPNERVALQANEFWLTICEEEVELAIEAREAQEYADVPETESRFFAKIAFLEIVPVLLQLLMKQEEDADSEVDEWNVSMATTICLTLLAGTVQDVIVPAAVPFTAFRAHISDQDWHYHEAATRIMTFGSILWRTDSARCLSTRRSPYSLTCWAARISMLRTLHYERSEGSAIALLA